MSITDEATRPPKEQGASNESQASSSGQSGTGLPGLAAFNQMQGYAPVTGGQQVNAHAEEHPEQPDHSGQHASDDAYHQDHGVEDQPEHEDTQNSDYVEQSYIADALDGYQEETQPHAHHEVHDYMAAQGEEAYTHDAHAHDPHAYGEESYQQHGGQSLQTFEAHYDQHPEIPLGGSFDNPHEAPGEQPFFAGPGQTGDADFMAGETAPDVAEPKERRGRKILMAASGLIGVLALGGALAFAYKIGGDSDIASSGKPPLIQADNSPVKVAPDKPGGKEFPHKNKKIYERLQGQKSDETSRLVSRQEDVAASATAALGQPVDATRGVSIKAPASGENKSAPGAPRKVKTLTVRPDGTIEPAEPKAKVVTAPGAASDGTVSMSFPQPSAPEPKVAEKTETTGAKPPPVTPDIPKPAVVTPPAPAPVATASAAPETTAAPEVAAPPPVQKPAVPKPAPQTAAVAPAAAPKPAPDQAPAASSGSYVVQVAARKSQTDALAAFADIQQKYPRLLNGYSPIIKRADLGNKGVWYRLNVGPVESKQVASALCSQLKSAGMRSCLVRAQ